MYLFEITVLSRYMRRSGIAGSYSDSIFFFFLGISILFSIVATSLNSHQQYRRVPFSPQPL